ncbi:SGNH/GDSL hydrolase family protein [Actinomadura oligospora]|uniref:SGNH/GDSL hydrolase family protein n=1 Tax=Actinomadura oligospora TaxID=111804 RepID=UPI00047B4354|nr:SGNH/GDSL hydrolase family protein [Actinomadura oligospora]
MRTPPLPRSEADDPWCLSSDQAADLLERAPWRSFATLGDSLSAGTGDPRPGYGGLGWPERVANVLRRVHPDLAYLNVAEVGATTSRTLRTQMDRLADVEPDLVHVPSGANDLFRADPDFTGIAAALGEVFRRAAATGAQLTVFTLGRAFVVPRFPDWTDRVRRVNDIVRDLAERHGAVLVDMWDHPVNDRPDLLSADGIHFAAPGQAVMAAEVVKGLAHLLDGARGAVDGGVRR